MENSGLFDESVGAHFDESKLIAARDKTLQLIETVARQMRPGTSEDEAKEIIKALMPEFGASRTWHPPQVRFGLNTLLPFGVPSAQNTTLKEDDIFFFDLGPVFDEHEGDVGRTFTLGNNSLMQKCTADVKTIWFEVQKRWQETQESGAALYEFAKERAQSHGWELSLKKANGHRISDFPHAARIRSSIEGLEQKPHANRWILEIQIHSPDKKFGAFYEDLLN